MQTLLGIPIVTLLMIAAEDQTIIMLTLEWLLTLQTGVVLNLFMIEDSVTAIHKQLGLLVQQELVQMFRHLLEVAGISADVGLLHMVMEDKIV
tara:strand:+ start:102 stop:380 length:279 start_codon:yes stop_codon:yes gene_type:complete